MLALVAIVCLFLAVFLAVQSFGRVWDGFSARYVSDLTPLMGALSLDQTKNRVYFRLWGAGLVACVVVFGCYLRMWPVAVAFTAIARSAPRLVLNVLIRRRRLILRDQMVTASVALANASRAGMSVADGLRLVGAELPEPLGFELQKIMYAYDHGRPLAEALRETSERLNADSFNLFVASLLTSLERGGRITQALERISHSLVEMQRVERKIETDTAGGRKVVWLLTSFPAFFLAFSHFANPQGTHDVFHSVLGQLTLFVVILLTWASFHWSQRIMAIEV